MKNIEQTNHENNGYFRIFVDGNRAGLMTYSWINENTFSIDHTETDPAYSGKGLGKDLVLAAVEFARENDLKIIPLCPFAKITFERNENIRDVLA